MSEVPTIWVKLPTSSEVPAQTLEVPMPTGTTKAVPNLTLWINNLTTPLPSGLVKMLGHSLDAEKPPNRRSSPKPKMKFRRERQTNTSNLEHTHQQAHGTQRFILTFSNPTKELLRPRS